jgi:ATP-dependent DNA helicase RecG
LALIADKPQLTAIAIARELSLSERWIRTLLSQLSMLKIIERNGSDKDGEWVVI